MPVYGFYNKKTKKEYELKMSYEELGPYLKKNKHLEQRFKMNLGDSVLLGIKRPPSDFLKYVMGKVKTVPGAKDIEKRYHIPKEI
jgi:ABC-type glycerol-3-phosphate transport system substrate-binding protein